MALTHQEAVERLERARLVLAEAQGRSEKTQQEHAARSRWDRLRKRPPTEEDVSSARHDVYTAKDEVRDALKRLADDAVGSLPGEWGVLSGRPWHTLENTLDRLTSYRIAALAPVAAELREMLAALPQARIDAHNGDRSPSDEIARRLAATLRPDLDRDTARAILHHLPGRLRPIPDVDLADIRDGGAFASTYFHYAEPIGGLRMFYVSLEEPGELRLHDIVVDQSSRGMGLGSAGLEHLCRTADHYRLPITGIIGPTLVPGDDEAAHRKREQSAERLARWYGRHGFVVTPRTDEYVYFHAEMRREPR